MLLYLAQQVALTIWGALVGAALVAVVRVAGEGRDR